MRNGLIDGDQLVRPTEAAALLALSRRTLRRYEINGQLRPVKLNSRVTRYRLADVLRLLGKEVAP
jgi:predicted site-specific integrase-resolvase